MKNLQTLLASAFLAGGAVFIALPASAQDEELGDADLGAEATDDMGASDDMGATDESTAMDDSSADSGEEADLALDGDDMAGDGSLSRFRWGINALGGPLMGGYKGGAGGIAARFGWQLDSLLGIYAQPVFLVGAGATASSNGASATGMALFGGGVLGDLTFGDFYYIALGPEVLFGGIGEASASTNSASASGSTGPYFSVDFRTGFALGSKHPDRRNAFIIGLDMHVVFAGKVALLPMVSLGYEAF